MNHTPLSLVNRLYDKFVYYSIKVSPINTKFRITQLLNKINYARDWFYTIHEMKMCACEETDVTPVLPAPSGMDP